MEIQQLVWRFGKFIIPYELSVLSLIFGLLLKNVYLYFIGIIIGLLSYLMYSFLPKKEVDFKPVDWLYYYSAHILFDKYFSLINLIVAVILYIITFLNLYSFPIITTKDMNNLILIYFLIITIIGYYFSYKIANHFGMNYINFKRKSKYSVLSHAFLSSRLLGHNIFEGVSSARISVSNYKSYIENEGYSNEDINKTLLILSNIEKFHYQKNYDKITILMDKYITEQIDEIITESIKFNDDSEFNWLRNFKKKRNIEPIKFNTLALITIIITFLSNFENIINALKSLELDKVLTMFYPLNNMNYTWITIGLALVMLIWITYIKNNSIEFELIEKYC